MADTIDITAGTGTTIATDDVVGVHYQQVKLVDGTLDATGVIAADIGVKANALRVAPANDITDATYIGDIKFGEAEPNSAAILADTTAILADTAAIQTAVELIDNAISGTEMQVDIVAALPAGTNTIGKLAANTGVDIGDVDILSIAAGDNNIGNVDIVTLPASTNTIEVVGDAAENAVAAGNPILVGGRYDATPRTLGDTDVGAIALDADGAVHIADGGNAITVDGTVTANLSATDNAVLDTIDAVLDAINTKLVTGTVIGDVNLGATDNAVLDAIAASDASIDGKITACNTGAVVLATGSAAIGKLAANTGVDIGDVDVTSIMPGIAATNLGKARDSALGATDTGVMALAVRDDTLTTLTPVDGDYVPLRVNSTGALHVTGAGGGTQYAEDAAHNSGATGTLALVVRKDTAAQLAGTDVDYSALITDVNGRLHVISSARANGVEAITDWAAVAQNAVGESGTIDCSGHDGTSLLIQAFLDTTTAHTGTEIVVQVSSNTTGNEDWHDYRNFEMLVGTAATDLIEDNPLTAGSTSLTLTGHALTEEGIWIAIENGTLANSELIYVASQTTNAVVALDGTTNEHALNTAVFNVAISKVIILDATVQRARVIVNNTKDVDGSSLNYKVRATKLTR